MLLFALSSSFSFSHASISASSVARLRRRSASATAWFRASTVTLLAFADSSMEVAFAAPKARVAELKIRGMVLRHRVGAAEASFLEGTANAERVVLEARSQAEVERELRRSIVVEEAEMEAWMKEKEVEEAKSNIESFSAVVYEVQASYPEFDLSRFYIDLSSEADAPVVEH